MTDVMTYLVALDGRVFAGIVLGIFAALLYLPGLIVRLGATEAGESMSERHERLDAEARAANVAAFESLPMEVRR